LLKLRSLTRDEVRGIDLRAAGEFGIPTIVLMENAGRGAAALLREQCGSSPEGLRVLILCGPGNNGGDGGVVARHLDLWGFAVKVVWFAAPERLSGDAAAQWHVLKCAGIDQSSWRSEPTNDRQRFEALLAGADWVVDALLGTGLTRPVEGTLAAAIDAMNGANKPVLALDLPSGLDADCGVPLGTAVRATLTATFVAPKLGFDTSGAREYTGDVHVIDVGVPRRLLEPFQAQPPPPETTPATEPQP
jgi:NAD(P)H-hydrate epimerase